MSVGAGEDTRMKKLDQQLRRLSSMGLVEVAPSPALTRWAFVQETEDPAQAGVWIASPQDAKPQALVTRQDMARLTKSEPANVLTRLRWSADGRLLAFGSYKGLPPGDGHKLWAMRADPAATPRLLYQGKGVISAHLWSPEGSRLAVADSGAGLVVAHLDETWETVDSEAMRYPLGENAMAWVEGGQRLLYTKQDSDKKGLWEVEMVSGQKRQLIELSEDEVAIPAGVNENDEVSWGVLRGHVAEPERGVELQFWSARGEKVEAIAPSVSEFDPASSLVPNRDGSWWAFTAWQDGQRVPFVVNRQTGQGCSPAMLGTVGQLIGWSETSPKLWVLLQPAQLVELDADRETAYAVPSGEPFSVELTSMELIYLLEALNARSMMGLTNPLTGLEEAKAQDLRSEAKASLIAKGWAAKSADDQIQIDLTIAALVQCCASPQQTWTTTFEVAMGERDVRHIHCAGDLIVEDKMLGSGLHRLTPLSGNSMLFHRVKSQIRLQSQPAAQGQPFAIAEEVLFRIREIAAAQGEETAASYLRGAGVAETPAAHFAQALARPVSNSSISRWTSGQEVSGGSLRGVGILEGPSGLWLLQSSVIEGNVEITVSPADAESALEQMAQLLSGEGKGSSA